MSFTDSTVRTACCASTALGPRRGESASTDRGSSACAFRRPAAHAVVRRRHHPSRMTVTRYRAGRGGVVVSGPGPSIGADVAVLGPEPPRRSCRRRGVRIRCTPGAAPRSPCRPTSRYRSTIRRGARCAHAVSGRAAGAGAMSPAPADRPADVTRPTPSSPRSATSSPGPLDEAQQPWWVRAQSPPTCFPLVATRRPACTSRAATGMWGVTLGPMTVACWPTDHHRKTPPRPAGSIPSADPDHPEARQEARQEARHARRR